MGNFRTFATNLRNKSNRLPRNADRMMQATVMEIFTTVVKATPADVGTAKSNWQLNLGRQAAGTVPAYVPGKHGSTARSNENAAIDKAAQVIAQYKPGNNVHLSNNVPHIGLLNDGSSSQAPAGFVEQAILRGREFLRRKRNLLKD